MENASKALIIAGAILLSILLISLGIMIFNQAQSVINGSGMSEAEITAFNSKFTKYTGRQKGSAIRSMVQEVLANNNNEEASAETRIAINEDNGSISTTGNNGIVSLGSGANAQPSYGTLVNTQTYTVSFLYNNGRVAVINVN